MSFLILSLRLINDNYIIIEWLNILLIQKDETKKRHQQVVMNGINILAMSGIILSDRIVCNNK